ncbi:MAG: hypothetical protein MAG451_02714 [Anaerolineales bacterium]|nr:hypothetical protein [Anaerolineales bacterium]
MGSPCVDVEDLDRTSQQGPRAGWISSTRYGNGKCRLNPVTAIVQDVVRIPWKWDVIAQDDSIPVGQFIIRVGTW